MNQSVISTRNTVRAVEFLRIPGAPVQREIVKMIFI